MTATGPTNTHAVMTCPNSTKARRLPSGAVSVRCSTSHRRHCGTGSKPQSDRIPRPSRRRTAMSASMRYVNCGKRTPNYAGPMLF